MAFRVFRDGVTSERHLEQARTLAEILRKDEYERVRNGTLVAMTTSGGLMTLDSPVSPEQVITLRAPQPERDLAGFGFPVNRAGDVVGVSEMLAIRKYEEANGEDFYELSLDEIRRRVRGSDPPGSAPDGFNEDVAALRRELGGRPLPILQPVPPPEPPRVPFAAPWIEFALNSILWLLLGGTLKVALEREEARSPLLAAVPWVLVVVGLGVNFMTLRKKPSQRSSTPMHGPEADESRSAEAVGSLAAQKAPDVPTFAQADEWEELPSLRTLGVTGKEPPKRAPQKKWSSAA